MSEVYSHIKNSAVKQDNFHYFIIIIMNGAATLLITSLILKDVVFISDPYISRGISQGLCLVVGTMWLFCNINIDTIRRYIILFCYIVILFLSGLFSNNMGYVLMQVLSIFSVIIFSVSYFEYSNNKNINIIYSINKVVVIVLAVIIMSSLLLAIIKPEITYGIYDEGDLFGNEKRFNGLFPKPSMIAASAGILFGLSFFSVKNIYFKFILIVSSCVCLLLTGSRTFWVSTFIALMMTIWFYNKKFRVYLAIFILFLSCVLLLDFYGRKNLSIYSNKSSSRLVRAESIDKLSGRTDIWKTSISVIMDSPVIGYGFTTGAEKLIGQHKLLMFERKIKDTRSLGRTTLHNGYIQSLLDTGLSGFIIYITAIYLSLYRVWKYDYEKIYSSIFYVIIFFAISNMGESTIYSTATFNGSFYWINSIAALSLKKYYAK